MYEQLVTELGIVKVEGIVVKLEQPENIPKQLVTELGIVKVERIVVNLEQHKNIPSQLVTESANWMISIVFSDAAKFEWLPMILIV